jgi:hypothetical protein
VFVSTDLGTTWKRLGNGLPNVPVVGLTFNQNLETLAAATQGRGVFTISTDLLGPHITGISSTPGKAAVTITFNEGIDPTTLTTSNVTLTGPGGAAVTITGINDLDTINSNVFSITFAASNPGGSYNLTIQPTVTDFASNPLDQNQNGVNGEVPGDVYKGRFLYQTTTPNTAPVLNSTAATFPSTPEDPAPNSGTDLATFVASLSITDPDGGAVKGIAVTGVDNSHGDWQYTRDDGVTWVDFGTPTGTSARLLEGSAVNRIRFVPNADFSSTATFTFVAWDLTSGLDPVHGNDGGVAPATPAGGTTAFSTAQGTATITVLLVNDPPSFTKGPDVTVLENSGAYSAAWATGLSAGPANESSQKLNFIVGNSNPALFAVPPAISPTGVLSFTPATDQFGDVLLTVTIHDDGGTANGGVDTSPPQFANLHVLLVNHAPSFTKGPDVAVPQDAGAVTIAGWAPNVSAGPPSEASQVLTFQVSTSNPDLFAAGPTVGADGTLRFTPSGLRGSAVVTLVLHDNGGTANGGQDTSALQSFTVTVTDNSFRGTPNEVWVYGVYLDLLGHAPSTASLNFWVDQLEADLPRPVAAQEITASAEYATHVVVGLYRDLLNQPAPSPDAVSIHVQNLLAGVSLDQEKAIFLGSSAYAAARGITTPAGFIQAVYQDELGHAAGPDGLSFWGGYLQQFGAQATALAILQSPEADGREVVLLYEALLGRDPRASDGINPWFVALQQGTPDAQVVGGIAASDEYFSRRFPNFKEAQLQGWLSQVYLDALARPLDSIGSALWLGLLNHGTSRQDITLQIVASQEYQTRVITQIYQALLNRAPSPMDINLRLGQFAAGATQEDVKADIMQSAEYYFGHGGGTDAGFLNAVYVDAIGVHIDSAGLQIFGPQLAVTPRNAIALEILQTPNAIGPVVQSYYTLALHRVADPVGLGYWVGQVQVGLRDEQVLAGLFSSREYFYRF